MIQSVAIFCGSQKGKNDLFATHAAMVGKLLAQQSVTMVYGGGNVGLMGIAANAALEYGGKVVGVIPKILDKMERSHTGVTELIITSDMHTRKRKMYELCDAALILPGGHGTMDEFFEMITWNNLSIHNKRIFILNTAGFYNQLLQHIFAMYEGGFLYEDPAQTIAVLNTPEEISMYF